MTHLEKKFLLVKASLKEIIADDISKENLDIFLGELYTTAAEYALDAVYDRVVQDEAEEINRIGFQLAIRAHDRREFQW